MEGKKRELRMKVGMTLCDVNSDVFEKAGSFGYFLGREREEREGSFLPSSSSPLPLLYFFKPNIPKTASTNMSVKR